MASVKVRNPKTNEIISEYYMNDRLKHNLDEKVIKQLESKDKDCVMVVDGKEGSGKCQPAGSKVLMANGEFKNIEDIKIGDLVISPQKDGTIKFANVVNTTNWFCNDVYNIIAINKKKKLYSCSGNHIIPLNYKDKFNKYKLKHVTPKDIINKSNKDFKRNNLSLVCPPIPKFYCKDNCIIEPYTLGALLGDGCLNVGNRALDITSADKEIIDEIEKTYVVMSVVIKKNCKAKRYRFSKYNYYTKIKALSLFDELKSLNLIGKKSGDKFIPKEALYSDINYRKRLLAGLIDTDGYRCSSNSYEIVTKSKQLAKDIQFLVNSIGGRCGEIKECIKGIKSSGFKGIYFRISFNFLGYTEIPCKVLRKKKLSTKDYIINNKNGHYVLRSEKTKSCHVYGFEIDSESHWYITDNFQITHNSTLAMQIGMAVDPTLNLNRIVFSPDDFRDAILNAKKGQCIIYDEAFTGFSSRASLSPVNRVLVSLAMQMRQKNLFIIIVLPTIFLLDKYMAMFRTKALIHVYENKGVRGYFKLFNAKKKQYLILKGQKTMSYLVKTKFRGRFYGKFALGDSEIEKKYRKKKEKALSDSEKTSMSSAQVKFKEQRDLMLWLFRSYTTLTYQQIENIISEYDFNMSFQQIGKICNKFGTISAEKVKESKENTINSAKNDENEQNIDENDDFEEVSNGKSS